MAKTPIDANGGTPITSSEDAVSRPPGSRSRRGRSQNAVGQSPSMEREGRASAGRAQPEQDPQRAAVNAIRPTPRRLRDMPLTDARRAVQERAMDHAVPDEIKRRFVQVGNKYHFPDGARAFTDHGNRLTSPSENSEVIKSLISIAQARGWSDITLSGTERFRKEAWFAARVAGLDVRGYSPTEFEQGRLVRTLAREQASASQDRPLSEARSTPISAPGVRSSADRGRDVSDSAGASSGNRQRSLQIGRLVDHGVAPYLHDPHNEMSYFLRIETPGGEREIWGVDLQRALKESLTGPRIGDEIGVRATRRDAVKVLRPERDEEGRVVGKKELETHRNAWIIEKRDFFRERAQAARVLRDANVDRQAAVKQHPELLGTYLQLHAAELAAKTIRNPDDQRRFVASVRTALADSVARGEPLPPVPLKEPPTQRREPRTPSAPHRSAAPSR